jgi:pimeloyl-[acyl-carrier protein] synthase
MNTALWKPLAEDNIRDPYAMYAALRAEDPVHKAQTGEFIITRYDDIREVLKSADFQSGNRLIWLKKGIHYFENKQEDFRAIYQAMNSFILMLNDSQHARIRNFISRAWSDREVDLLIHKNIHAALDGVKEVEFDFVAGYAQPVPVHTIADILGVPVSDYHHLMQLGVAMTKTLDLYVTLKDLVTMNQAAKAFIEYFREQIRRKQATNDDGLLSKLIQKNRNEKAGLSEEELISIGIFLFTAGEETSAGLISTAMLHLVQHPDQLHSLRENPAIIDLAIDEALRYDSVVQLLGRMTRKSVSLGGKIIPEGSAVTLVIGSGNRDEKVFEHSDRFVIARRPNRHLSFGSGVHYCLGDWLGRRQAQLTVNAFLQRFPNITLPPQQLSWYNNIAVRRLDALRINVS